MVKSALFRNLKLWWVTTEGLWLPCEIFLGDGWHCSAGWHVLVRQWTCHTSARTSNFPKGKKNTQHHEGVKSKAGLQLWWQKCQSFQRRQQKGDLLCCTELPWTPAVLSCLFTQR